MLTDAGVFDGQYQPDRLLHREGELDAVVHGLDDCGVMLHGSSGVGKTTLAQHALDVLGDERAVPTAHVKCLGATTATVLRRVLRQFPGPDPAANTPQEDLSLRLYERVDEPAVVALDEAAHVHGLDALDRLLDVPELSVIVICHDPDEWLAAADRDTRKRFSGTEVGLDRFAVDELADILAARARVGLRDDAWERDHLERIADDVAGVARAGVQTLHQAAKESERRGYEQIRADVLENARELAQRRILTYNLHSMPIHHQVLYEIVRQGGGEVAPEELNSRYDEIAEEVYADRADTPITKRTRRRKLGKLEDYELITIEGTNRNRRYRVVDKEVGPPIGFGIPPN